MQIHAGGGEIWLLNLLETMQQGAHDHDGVLEKITATCKARNARREAEEAEEEVDDIHEKATEAGHRRDAFLAKRKELLHQVKRRGIQIQPVSECVWEEARTDFTSGEISYAFAEAKRRVESTGGHGAHTHLAEAALAVANLRRATGGALVMIDKHEAASTGEGIPGVVILYGNNLEKCTMADFVDFLKVRRIEVEADTGRGDTWLTGAFAKIRYASARFCRLHRIDHFEMAEKATPPREELEPSPVLSYLLATAKVLYPNLKKQGKLRGSHLRHSMEEWICYLNSHHDSLEHFEKGKGIDWLNHLLHTLRPGELHPVTRAEIAASDRPSSTPVSVVQQLKHAEEVWTLLLSPDDDGVMCVTREHVRAVAFLLGYHEDIMDDSWTAGQHISPRDWIHWLRFTTVEEGKGEHWLRKFVAQLKKGSVQYSILSQTSLSDILKLGKKLYARMLLQPTPPHSRPLHQDLQRLLYSSFYRLTGDKRCINPLTAEQFDILNSVPEQFRPDYDAMELDGGVWDGMDDGIRFARWCSCFKLLHDDKEMIKPGEGERFLHQAMAAVSFAMDQRSRPEARVRGSTGGDIEAGVPGNREHANESTTEAKPDNGGGLNPRKADGSGSPDDKSTDESSGQEGVLPGDQESNEEESNEEESNEEELVGHGITQAVINADPESTEAVKETLGDLDALAHEKAERQHKIDHVLDNAEEAYQEQRNLPKFNPDDLEYQPVMNIKLLKNDIINLYNKNQDLGAGMFHDLAADDGGMVSRESWNAFLKMKFQDYEFGKLLPNGTRMVCFPGDGFRWLRSLIIRLNRHCTVAAPEEGGSDEEGEAAPLADLLSESNKLYWRIHALNSHHGHGRVGIGVHKSDLLQAQGGVDTGLFAHLDAGNSGAVSPSEWGSFFSESNPCQPARLPAARD